MNLEAIRLDFVPAYFYTMECLKDGCSGRPARRSDREAHLAEL
jgi:hypothetical protein